DDSSSLRVTREGACGCDSGENSARRFASGVSLARARRLQPNRRRAAALHLEQKRIEAERSHPSRCSQGKTCTPALGLGRARAAPRPRLSEGYGRCTEPESRACTGERDWELWFWLAVRWERARARAPSPTTYVKATRSRRRRA